MTVQKVSFTSENPLLNKIKTPAQFPVVQTAPVAKAEAETSPEAPTKNHKVRNWTIGLSAAAVLTALGVVSGRRGYLGEGVQKVLGGAKNKAGELAEDLEHRSEELVDDIVGEAKPKTPEVKPAASTPKPEPAVKPTSSHKIDVDRINAKLNRTIPKINEPLTVKIPDALEGIDRASLRKGWQKITLPNGNTRSISIQKDGKLSFIIEHNKAGETLWSQSFLRGNLHNYSITKGNREISYTSKGKISWILEFTQEGKNSRQICLQDGTNNVDSISYYNPKTEKLIKTDMLKNGTIYEESFYGSDISDIIETIKH